MAHTSLGDAGGGDGGVAAGDEGLAGGRVDLRGIGVGVGADVGVLGVEFGPGGLGSAGAELTEDTMVHAHTELTEEEYAALEA